MEVPEDSVQQLNFYLAEASAIARYGVAPAVNTGSCVSNILKSVMNYHEGNYRELIVDVVAESYSFLQKNVLDTKIKEVASLFIESVVKFGESEFYITSGDIFLHNRFSIDDCAYGLDPHEVFETPQAKLKANTYLGTNTYYELSIFWGSIEFLVTGGYYTYRNESVQLFLGSSITGWKYGELTSDKMYTLKELDQKALLATVRLLNQYFKRDSHRLWGFHSTKAFAAGHTPIVLLQLADHVSQRNKEQDIHHIASKLLFFVTRRELTAKDEINDLFLYFAGLKALSKYCEGKSVLSFNGIKAILEDQTKVPVYLNSLVGIAADIENIVNRYETCYVFLLLKNAKDISLNIMKGGLKGRITKQTEIILKIAK